MSKGKKGAASLQIDVKTDEEWDELLQLQGLILVDIYSEWSGPCSAMVSAIKNIKLEVGGDWLKLATAQNDEITSLTRFRERSEPVWMFIDDGKVVNMFFGANCPKLKHVLMKEIRRVMEKRLPKYKLAVEQRTPDEEARFRQEESKQRLSELRRMSREEEELRGKNEKFLKRMMIELSEETALVIFPWVFYDDHGNQIDKEQSAPYVDLVFKVLPEKFDVVEQVKIQLDEEIIEKMFLESEIIVTDDLIQALIDGKCLALRLKGRLPPADWPVPYPYTCAEAASDDCPTRAINDIENFLLHVLTARPRTSNVKIKSKNFLERHRLIVSTGEESEDSEEVIEYPAVWFPPNARSKIHVFTTLFSAYMSKAHPYEEPTKPAPLCAFKFKISRLQSVTENYQQFQTAIEHFGIFEFDDPRARRLASNPVDFTQRTTVNQNGNEVILIIVRKINENIFLAFAGNYPIFVEENAQQINQIVDDYFPEGAVDFNPDKYLSKYKQYYSGEDEEEDYLLYY